MWLEDYGETDSFSSVALPRKPCTKMRMSEGIPIKRRLEGVPVNKRLEGVPVKKRLEGVPYDEVLEEIPVKNRLEGIPPQVLKAYLDKLKKEGLV